ncbi:CHAT domain-containing protein [Nostoc sphaeroides CCNUC1]|uniref:CHAT domain-containing protein n=1 Tax=Nostoc sphaeroides CCNUC1 TaxID=2653204 RepID=A0A5P8WCA2_9NOSO|nr:CHAT domain-containing protein [Nostoc sphaeroides CCNUC1]
MSQITITHTLVEATAANKDNSPAQQPNKSSLVKTAKQLNATLVQLVLRWLVCCSGEGYGYQGKRI